MIWIGGGSESVPMSHRWDVIDEWRRSSDFLVGAFSVCRNSFPHVLAPGLNRVGTQSEVNLHTQELTLLQRMIFFLLSLSKGVIIICSLCPFISSQSTSCSPSHRIRIPKSTDVIIDYLCVNVPKSLITIQ